jgi:apolipoprotein N-acyltransferase
MFRLSRAGVDQPVLLAAVAGALAVLAFPDFGFWPLGLFLLVPLLAALEGQGAGRALRLGLVMGLVYFLGSLSWIEYTLVRFGGMPRWLAYPTLCLLAGYLALFPGLFGVLYVRTRASRWPLALRVGVLWVATEGLRGYLLTGFPWNLLGQSLHRQQQFLQLADLGGAYGLSLFLAVFSGATYVALVGPGRAARARGLALGAALLACGWWYGEFRLSAPLPNGVVRIALVQHNAPQDHKWDANFRREIVENLLKLSALVVDRNPDLIVWPEGATPFRFRNNPLYRRIIGDFVAAVQIPLLFGAPDKDPQRDRHYNSAFLLDVTGDISAQYRKMQLVPFGEYVPLPSVLFFVEKLADVGGSFYPGEAYTLFELGQTRFSTFICFESAFGEIVRNFSRRGAQFLVTITNDAWFGDTAGTSQHESFLPLRAVETRRPVAQAAQSGFTAVYDQKGALLGRTELLVPATLVADIHPAEPGQRTLYLLFGNWVVFGSWACSAWLAFATRRKR